MDLDAILRAFEALGATDKKPNVRDVNKHVKGRVSAAQRDEAWAAWQAGQRPTQGQSTQGASQETSRVAGDNSPQSDADEKPAGDSGEAPAATSGEEKALSNDELRVRDAAARQALDAIDIGQMGWFEWPYGLAPVFAEIPKNEWPNWCKVLCRCADGVLREGWAPRK